MSTPARDLGGGAHHYQVDLWQTNSLVVVRGDDALLFDPCLRPEEVLALRDAAFARGARHLYVLVTHGDYDHVCGVGLLPEAVVVSGRSTATLIDDGSAGDALRAGAAEWGISWSCDLRVDRVVDEGEAFSCGAFAIESIEAPGHAVDGVAYLLREQGILVCGDYLGATSFPWVSGSLDDARATYDRLLRVIESREVRCVVPGHGPVLSQEEALRIGADDVDYLDRLAQAAHDAAGDGLAPSWAYLRVYEVEPPRPADFHFEAFSPRGFNCRQALAQVVRGPGALP